MAQRIIAIVGLWLTLVGLPVITHAQQVEPLVPEPPLRVFLDCYQCDFEYLRQNVTFVDYMRDRTDANLHVLVTTQGTGGGGTSWTVRFIGLGRFLAEDRVHQFATPQAATSDDLRQAFARVFRLGLAGYATDTAVAGNLDVVWRPPAQSATASPATDPWNLWVFRLSSSGNANGERSSQSWRYGFSLGGSRVTSDWKINFSTNVSKSESRFTLSDGRTVKSPSDSWSVNSLVGKTMGPKFSVGGRINASHSSFSNTDRAVSIYPGFEYDFFPYSDFQHKSLTIWYEIGPSFYDYREVTIFDKLKETVIKQQADFTLALRQPWGSLRTTTSISQDVRHRDRYSASVYGSTDVSLFKGFAFNIYASYSKIKDQISLVREGASLDEVLLRLQQLQTNYRYDYGLGFSYTFGSIFNSVVNPRFNGQAAIF